MGKGEAQHAREGILGVLVYGHGRSDTAKAASSRLNRSGESTTARTGIDGDLEGFRDGTPVS
jgi:hypothetical protein